MRNVELSCDSQGRFFRNVGFKARNGGKFGQHKFWLGKDRKHAERALARLLELWTRIEELQREENERYKNDLAPVWNYATLKAGKAVAKGEATVGFKLGEGASLAWGQLDDICCDERPRDFVERLKLLAVQFPVIAFIPSESASKAFEKGQWALQVEAQAHEGKANHARQMIGQPVIGDRMLFDCFDDYKDWIEAEYATDGGRTEWGQQQLRNVDRLKEHGTNIPLSAVNLTAIEKMLRTWRQRPLVKGKDQPMATSTIRHHIKQLKNFCGWLHRSENHAWRKPEEFDELRFKVEETADELAARVEGEQVKTVSLDQLIMLNEYATPIERVLLLLGLNCGFNPASMGTLTRSEIFFGQNHRHALFRDLSQNVAFKEFSPDDSFIFRVRRKKRVYGEHLLFPQTVMALEWAIERQRRIIATTNGNVAHVDKMPLLISENGVPFFKRTSGHNSSQSIQNKWNSLIRRVTKDYPDFPKLSVSKLRKTAGDFVRQKCGGEVMAVFLNHSQTVKVDDMAERYSNRPFGRTFDAIKIMEDWLAPMFHAAPDDPFPAVRAMTGHKISKGQIKTIKRLRRAGKPVRVIAEKAKVSASTVYRIINATSPRSLRTPEPELVKQPLSDTTVPAPCSLISPT